MNVEVLYRQQVRMSKTYRNAILSLARWLSSAGNSAGARTAVATLRDADDKVAKIRKETEDAEER